MVRIIQHILESQEPFFEVDYSKILASESDIKKKFNQIWKTIIRKTELDIPISTALSEIKNMVLYDILDGNRSTIVSKTLGNNDVESGLFVINLIHTLKTLNARNCYIMIHTSYNRERGEKEFTYILRKISLCAPLIKEYAIQNSISCSCIGMEKNYELTSLLNDIVESTKNGDFHVYFLFDYNERWGTTKEAQHILNALPDIDVHIRHTKFQISGGWIPEKMSHSVFLYSQNGTTYSNWSSDELITLIALALLEKLIHKGEILHKIYTTQEEVFQRYELRELKLFNKVIHLREHPKKLFIMGSPIGVYQFYY